MTRTEVTDRAELQRAAEVYRNVGWPAEVAGDAFTAPHTAPNVLDVGSAVGVNGATKWTLI